jgi:hypothetical protein
MSHDRRDSNEKKILDIFKRAGGFWQPCTRMQGHDGYLILHGMIFAVEIKDGEKPLSQRLLTPREKQFKRNLELRGVRLWIILNEEDALNLVNGEYAAIPERREYETLPFDDPPLPDALTTNVPPVMPSRHWTETKWKAK